jgi:micrococcal nuclease
MSRPFVLLGLGLVVAATAWLVVASPRRGPQPRLLPAPTTVEANATVTRVVDGDTVVITIGATTESVRLIGVDTPETVDERKPVQCYGPEASARTAALLPPGTPVRLERDAEARDQYGRLLAYVVRASDGLFINVALVRDGYGTVLVIEPNDAYVAQLRDAEATARAAGAGLWGACGGPGLPASATTTPVATPLTAAATGPGP